MWREKLFGEGHGNPPERLGHLERGRRGRLFYGLPVVFSEEGVAGLRFRATVGRGVSQGAHLGIFPPHSTLGRVHTAVTLMLGTIGRRQLAGVRQNVVRGLKRTSSCVSRAFRP